MANNQLVCVRRPEASLYATFEDMYLNERLVDVTLFCNDGQIQAHKLVLAACSPYFSNLFEKLSNPFHHPVIVLKDMRIDDLKLILEFIYRGQLSITQERMTSLLKSADNLQISGLSTSNASEFGIDNTNQPNNSGGNQKKRAKKGSTSNINSNHLAYVKSYQTKHLTNTLLDNVNLDLNQTTSTTNINNHAATFFNSSDPTSSSIRNLNSTNSLHTPSPNQSSIHHLQNLPGLDNHHQGSSHHQQASDGHQLNNSQLQILSQSLTTNRANSSNSFSFNQNSHNITQQQHQQQQQLQQQQQYHQNSQQLSNNSNHHNQSQSPQLSPGGNLHQCNICLKPFREKANLKRHLTIHSQDRVIYPCPDCNKTFTWKDNYIRHTKTSHHLNNVRTRKQ